jgi:hypothetical protein
MLDVTPDNTFWRLPQILVTTPSFSGNNPFQLYQTKSTVVSQFLSKLALYNPGKCKHKILWVDCLAVQDNASVAPHLHTIIIDTTNLNTRVFFANQTGNTKCMLCKASDRTVFRPWLSIPSIPVKKYVPSYQAQENYFAHYKKLGKMDAEGHLSTQDLLTQEAIEHIKTVLVHNKVSRQQKQESFDTKKALVKTIVEHMHVQEKIKSLSETLGTHVMTTDEAEATITELLHTMPDNTVLNIPHIIAPLCAPQKSESFLISLTRKLSPINGRKILWIGKILHPENPAVVIARDCIIDHQHSATHVLLRDCNKTSWDYMPPEFDTSMEDTPDDSLGFKPFRRGYEYFYRYLFNQAGKTMTLNTNLEYITMESISRRALELESDPMS